MTTPSNLYAEKVFAEHPVSLWPLDENCDYFSYAVRDTSIAPLSPEVSVYEATNYPGSVRIPGMTVFAADLPQTTLGQISSSGISFSKVQGSLPFYLPAGEFVISAYINTSSLPALSFLMGYVDAVSQAQLQPPKSYPISTQTGDSWMFISSKFKLTEPKAIVPYVQFLYSNTNQSSDNTVYIYAMNVSADGEEFLPTSMGVTDEDVINISQITSVNGLLGIPAEPYGAQEDRAYYAFRGDFTMCARNSGIPMVYGAQNVTRLYSNGSRPSMVFPTKEFLSINYSSSEYTAEFWLRAKTSNLASGRIFGPTDTDDGLYIDQEFIRLKIGDRLESHYLGSWFRPMLLDLRVSDSRSSLLINSEEVISIDTSELDRSQLSSSGWSGFYCPAGVDYMELDAFALYSYSVPSIIAKRRMAYAQGVEAPDGTSKTFGGKLALIDYSVADYTSNYSYPDIGRFNQGISSNMLVNRSSISPPDYPAQPIFFKSSDLESLISNSENEDQVYGYSGLSLKKDTAYFKFNTLSLLNSSVSGVFGVFKPGTISVNVTFDTQSDEFSHAVNSSDLETGDKIFLSGISGEDLIPVGEYYAIRVSANSFKIADTYSDAIAELPSTDSKLYTNYKVEHIDEQTIILVHNRTNGDTFKISMVDGGLRYSSNISSVYREMLFEPGIADKPLFAIGFSLENMASYFGEFMSSFFANPSQLEMFVGSNEDFSNRFIGSIFRFGLCDAKNYSSISQYFLEYSDEPYEVGTVDLNPNSDPSFWSLVLDGGDPASDYGIVQLLAHVATYTIVVKNIFGIVSLDIATNSYWQDSVALSHFAQYVLRGSSSYYDLDFIQLNIDYPSNHDTSSGFFDSSRSKVKTYISFQPTATGANQNLESFSLIEKLSSSRTVIPGSNWLTTAYEVVDQSIIYPPKNVKIEDLSIVIHIEMNVDGVNSNRVSVKRIELASQAFNDETANPIGTKYGVSLYPFVRYGSYIDSNAINPFLIYKRSTPHLYLTDSSGIQILGDQDQYISRGIYLDVNESRADNYKVKSLQMFLLPKFTVFPEIPYQVFEIEHLSGTIKFFIKSYSTDGKRGILQAINSQTGRSINGIAYYINGRLVKDAVLRADEWTSLGISFAIPLSFDLFPGALRISGTMMFNAISYYESARLEEIERQDFRSWQGVLSVKQIDGSSAIQQWIQTLRSLDGQTYNWADVLVRSSVDYYGADISTLYGSYIGTNKIIVDDRSEFMFGNSQFLVKTNVSRSSFITVAV
jgi:hypothetical protein